MFWSVLKLAAYRHENLRCGITCIPCIINTHTICSYLDGFPRHGVTSWAQPSPSKKCAQSHLAQEAKAGPRWRHGWGRINLGICKSYRFCLTDIESSAYTFLSARYCLIMSDGLPRLPEGSFAKHTLSRQHIWNSAEASAKQFAKEQAALYMMTWVEPINAD